MAKLYMVRLPRRPCCGVIAGPDGTIIYAAPIVGWSVGKSIESLTGWVRGKRGGSVTFVKEVRDEDRGVHQR